MLMARGIKITTAAVQNLERHNIDNLVRMHRNVDFIPRLWHHPKNEFPFVLADTALRKISLL
jgi:hypothetical protein